MKITIDDTPRKYTFDDLEQGECFSFIKMVQLNGGTYLDIVVNEVYLKICVNSVIAINLSTNEMVFVSYSEDLKAIKEAEVYPWNAHLMLSPK